MRLQKARDTAAERQPLTVLDANLYHNEYFGFRALKLQKLLVRAVSTSPKP
jgi:hypothetical protein